MRKLLFCYLIFFLTAAICGAQVPFFETYSLLKKKEHLQINTMLQDKQGFLWLGTRKGLFRFDGKVHTQFTTRDSLPHDNVTAIAQDSLGRIWTGHSTGQIAFFEKGRFHNFEPEEGTSTQPVSDILFDRQGVLWFGTLNDGLYYFIQNRLYRLDEQEGMPDLYVYDIVQDTDGNILVGTDGGIAKCTLRDRKVSIQRYNYSNGLPDNIIKKIVAADGTSLFVATEDAGIIQCDLHSNRFTSIIKNWSYGPVTDFVIKGSQFWIACPQKGLLLFDIKTGQLRLYSNAISPGTTLINTLLQDNEGNIWAGSKFGLFRTPGISLQFISPAEGSDNANILAVTTDSDENIWYSSNSGLFKRSVDTEGIVRIIKPLAGTSFDKFTVISLYTDARGFVWAGLYGEGVLCIDPMTGKIRHLNRELRNGNILNITGKDDVVWLSTLGGSSRIVIKDEDLTVENIGRAEGLSSDFIYQILVDSKNRVWFATDGKGLDMMDEQGFHNIEKGLPSKIIYSVLQDGEGTIWVNVQGNGLYKLSDKMTFEPVAGELVVRESELHSMRVDKDGNLVLMHDSGMDIIDVAKKRIRYLGDEAGLRDKIANLNASGQDRTGNLLFGTSAGIIKYTGSQDYLDRSPTPIINTVKIFDNVVDVSVITGLSYDQNNLTFNYVGLWYQSPENVFFSYKLENYERDWINTKNTAVTYSHLPPGEYVFKVKVSATENFAEAKEASLAFTVHPPFWRTTGFYIVACLLFIVSGYGIVKFRERKLLRDKVRLEARVRSRTMEVQRQNDEIQAQNEEIMAQAEEIKGINENLELIVQERTTELERKNKALEEYAFINAHKLRSPVASILGLVNLISKTRLDDEGKEINKRLKQSAQELDDIVRSITQAIERGEQESTITEKHK